MRRFWLPIFWMGFISLTSSTVISSKQFTKAVATSTPIAITEEGFATFWQSWWWLFVKGYHALEFFVLAFLLTRAIGRNPVLAWLTCVACACLDEWHQTFVPARGGRVTDVLIDSAGALVGVLFWQWLQRPTAANSG